MVYFLPRFNLSRFNKSFQVAFLLLFSFIFLPHAVHAQSKKESKKETPKETKKLPRKDSEKNSKITAEQAEQKLELAKEAFRKTEYGKIINLLSPVDAFEKALPVARQIEARELLAVGYFVDAQNSTTETEKKKMNALAKASFWRLLKNDPDHKLDALLFPSSILEMYSEVQREHAEELVNLKKANGQSENTENVLYIERKIEQKTWAINFAPFGMGQFQNEHPVKGTLFAVAQTLSLGINITSFLVIESLRNPKDGRFPTSPNGGDFATALLWRNIMWASLGIFFASYAGSVWDGISFFEETKVRIRTLDEAPPELNPNFNNLSFSTTNNTGNVFELPIGLSFRWNF